MREAERHIKSVKINRAHDVPYLAGSSKDGKTVFVDRRLPKVMTVGSKRFDPVEFLLWHEIPEKMLTQQSVKYQDAHLVAERIEKEKVKAAGIDWAKYNRKFSGYIRETEDESITNPPKTLDMKPYRDEHDRGRMKKLYAMMRKTK